MMITIRLSEAGFAKLRGAVMLAMCVMLGVFVLAIGGLVGYVVGTVAIASGVFMFCVMAGLVRLEVGG